MDINASIGIFDSGVGGLKVLSALRKALPQENFVYVFDRSHSPYGSRSEKYIIKRACKITEFLLKQNVKAIVVACNTATTVAIKTLREKYAIPFVGVEPPIKPAIRSSSVNKILVMCTPMTAKQQSVLKQIGNNNEKDIRLLPCPNLATKIERNICCLSDIKPYLMDLLTSQANFTPDAIVLGCTHYYFITNLIRECFSYEVKIFDSSVGVSRQTKTVLKKNGLLSITNKGIVKYIYL